MPRRLDAGGDKMKSAADNHAVALFVICIDGDEENRRRARALSPFSPEGRRVSTLPRHRHGCRSSFSMPELIIAHHEGALPP